MRKPARVITKPQKQVVKYCQEWTAKTHLKQGHYMLEFNILMGRILMKHNGTILTPKPLLMTFFQPFYLAHPHNCKVKEWNRKMSISNKHTGPKNGVK